MSRIDTYTYPTNIYTYAFIHTHTYIYIYFSAFKATRDIKPKASLKSENVNSL